MTAKERTKADIKAAINRVDSQLAKIQSLEVRWNKAVDRYFDLVWELDGLVEEWREATDSDPLPGAAVRCNICLTPLTKEWAAANFGRCWYCRPRHLKPDVEKDL